MYILKGPPDAMEPYQVGGTFRGATDQNNNFVTTILPFETWTYRHIDGSVNPVVYQFVDKGKNGEYTLEYDPSAKVK